MTAIRHASIIIRPDRPSIRQTNTVPYWAISDSDIYRTLQHPRGTIPPGPGPLPKPFPFFEGV